MIDKDLIISAVKGPMAQYCDTMRNTIGDWQPLLTVSEKILAGEEVRNDEVQPELQSWSSGCGSSWRSRVRASGTGPAPLSRRCIKIMPTA